MNSIETNSSTSVFQYPVSIVNDSFDTKYDIDEHTKVEDTKMQEYIIQAVDLVDHLYSSEHMIAFKRLHYFFDENGEEFKEETNSLFCAADIKDSKKGYVFFYDYYQDVIYSGDELIMLINPKECDSSDGSMKINYLYGVIRLSGYSAEEHKMKLLDSGIPYSVIMNREKDEVFAVVKMDSNSPKDYKDSYDFICTWFENYKVKVLRGLPEYGGINGIYFPGTYSGESYQSIFGLYDSEKTWYDWIKSVTQSSDNDSLSTDNYPPFVPLKRYLRKPPEQKPQLIEEILRKGHIIPIYPILK